MAANLTEEELERERRMTEGFQYLKPDGWGGNGHPLYVAVRSEQVKSVPVASNQDAHAVGMMRDAEMEAVSARFAADLAALGAVRAYIRYDGGDDEGFAYFDHCVFKDGSVRNDSDVFSLLRASGAKGFPADEVADEWTARLLGQGYGTGEYRMYGAFWVDLETGLVTDDPNATPRGA
jgi:hypothetical protein